MANMKRVVTEWNGLGGLPGVSVMHFNETETAAVAGVGAFFAAIADRFPVPLSWHAPSGGDLIDEATGQLAGTWTEGAGFTVPASAGESFAAGVGARVRWETGGIISGRRVRGSTFLCPVGTNNYDSSGTIAPLGLADFQAAALVLATTTLMVVWHRPTSIIAADGQMIPVNNASVADRVSWLRTRRS